MTKLGLSEQKLDEILEQAGIGGEHVVSAANIRAAIARAIVENNKAVEKQVTDIVAGKLMKGLR